MKRHLDLQGLGSWPFLRWPLLGTGLHDLSSVDLWGGWSIDSSAIAGLHAPIKDVLQLQHHLHFSDLIHSSSIDLTLSLTGLTLRQVFRTVHRHNVPLPQPSTVLQVFRTKLPVGNFANDVDCLGGMLPPSSYQAAPTCRGTSLCISDSYGWTRQHQGVLQCKNSSHRTAKHWQIATALNLWQRPRNRPPHQHHAKELSGPWWPHCSCWQWYGHSSPQERRCTGGSPIFPWRWALPCTSAVGGMEDRAPSISPPHRQRMFLGDSAAWSERRPPHLAKTKTKKVVTSVRNLVTSMTVVSASPYYLIISFQVFFQAQPDGMEGKCRCAWSRSQ